MDLFVGGGKDLATAAGIASIKNEKPATAQPTPLPKVQGGVSGECFVPYLSITTHTVPSLKKLAKKNELVFSNFFYCSRKNTNHNDFYAEKHYYTKLKLSFTDFIKTNYGIQKFIDSLML